MRTTVAPVFAIYTQGASDALVRVRSLMTRWGRYLGRNRPAAGFSLDIKQLVSVVSPRPLKRKPSAPLGEGPGVQRSHPCAPKARRWCMLPGHGSEVDEFRCDRELIRVGDRWVVRAIWFLIFSI